MACTTLCVEVAAAAYFSLFTFHFSLFTFHFSLFTYIGLPEIYPSKEDTKFWYCVRIARKISEEEIMPKT